MDVSPSKGVKKKRLEERDNQEEGGPPSPRPPRRPSRSQEKGGGAAGGGGGERTPPYGVWHEASFTGQGVGARGDGGKPRQGALAGLRCVDLALIAEFLGTPPRALSTNCMPLLTPTFTFLNDLCSMCLVCRNWRDAVWSENGVWKAICKWRWPAVFDRAEDIKHMQQVLSFDPRHRHLTIKGRRYSVWLDFILRAGRCVSGTGCGRSTGMSWPENYTMIVDIFTRVNGHVRLLSGACPIELVQQQHDPQTGTATWYGVCTRRACWGNCYRWPLQLFLGESVEDEMGALCNQELVVQVLLLNKNNNKLAVWHRNNRSGFRKEDPEDVHSAIKEMVGRKLVLVHKDMTFQQVSRLTLVEKNDLTYIGFELEIATTGWVDHMDFSSLFEMLPWV